MYLSAHDVVPANKLNKLFDDNKYNPYIVSYDPLAAELLWMKTRNRYMKYTKMMHNFLADLFK